MPRMDPLNSIECKLILITVTSALLVSVGKATQSRVQPVPANSVAFCGPLACFVLI